MSKTEILIIDDEPQIRKLLEITLESNDYKVRQADTGKAGIILAANHPPEIILLEIGLPDKSGHVVLKEIWGVGSQTENQYLRLFLSALRKKIETNPNQPQHIFTESGVGYRFV